MNDHEFLDFQPCMFMRCGHRQTVLGTTLPGGRFPYRAQPHTLPLSDGDVLVVHDDVPASWKETDGVALLVHGLGGDHRSGYMVRVAAKLNRCGVRVFRMDQRGCGAAGAGSETWPGACSQRRPTGEMQAPGCIVCSSQTSGARL